MKLHNLLAEVNVVFLCYGTITLRVNLVTSAIIDRAAITIHSALSFRGNCRWQSKVADKLKEKSVLAPVTAA
ncbi:hypothetical protein [Bradyrhizobium sp. Leo170]|uniref:hypothetical protein n=1 Tax=Bradyrhizobium sp. Leo170 TaxID=1571199 RepID=UPI0013EE9714|nr:hypothetical protein [Bradyrhizobium sp. Leo170]